MSYFSRSERYRKNTEGDQFWYDEDHLVHRDGYPAIIWATGDLVYYQHGKLHRVDGPASIYTCGHRAYYQDNRLHRLDGPAIDFTYKKEWFINGQKIDCQNNEEFLRIVKLKNLL
jgi:hypothetical protein